MKKTVFYLVFLFSLGSLTSCALPAQPTDLPIQHADPFYNFDHDNYPLLNLPLIKPVEAKRWDDGSSLWRVFLPDGPLVRVPDEQDIIYYGYNIEELEKFAVSNGVIMAYSAYVNKEADAYIQDNYYHWFVIIPEKVISEGFHTEEEFREYIQALGISNPDWQTPDEAYEQFTQTGCLEWFPDCQ